MGRPKVVSIERIFNDLERPLSPITRSHHYIMLNISETVRNTHIVSMEYLSCYTIGIRTPYSTVSFRMTEWLGKIFNDTIRSVARSLRELSFKFLFRTPLAFDAPIRRVPVGVLPLPFVGRCGYPKVKQEAQCWDSQPSVGIFGKALDSIQQE